MSSCAGRHCSGSDNSGPAVIVTCVRRYLRFSLRLRDVEELMAERNLTVDHTTVWRCGQAYAP
jgi:transposase-like protein